MAVTTAIVDSRPKVRAGDPLAVSMVSTRNRGNASGAKATRSIDAGSVTKKRRDYVGKTPAKAAQALPPAIAAVVVGFAKAAGQLGLAATLSGLKDPTSFGAELAQLAATRATLHTATGGHVNVAEAAKILGVKSRQAVHQ
ncbi:MAG TPA: hypothetical protein VFN61_05650, partial [Acidimicrobiales bacterium]|nr:hypothetical protein [Acidimicrobiales bacterium]